MMENNVITGHPREQVSKKRKRTQPLPNAAAPKNISLLELSVFQTPKGLNKIPVLREIARQESQGRQHDSPATAALCRIFSRLQAEQRFSKTRRVSDANPNELRRWLRRQLNGYMDILLQLLEADSENKQELGLTLAMDLACNPLKIAGSPGQSKQTDVKPTDLMKRVLYAILRRHSGLGLCRRYVDSYVQRFGDMRYLTLTLLSEILSENHTDSHSNSVTDNALVLLSYILPVIKDNESEQRSLYAQTEPIVAAQVKMAQKAWSNVLVQTLSKSQRKRILDVMTTRIVPWFPRCELLMDFLGDSFREGGATSLLSLAGLYHIMRERNIDYPEFYVKLYSMVDNTLLHSRHRSRFFRLLEVFMSSTHLPVTLVASFIKRLSRLTLHSPPAGIVAILPWIYNMLQLHATCTFMIHRQPRCEAEVELLGLQGAQDPFNSQEIDPTQTGAIHSCLWELVGLQSHYHPNVASLARIMSEQFTRQAFDIEHFLDYSYTTLIDTELAKRMKSSPVVEFQIPKQVFVELSEKDDLHLCASI